MDFFTFDDEYVRRLREGDRETVEHFGTYFHRLLGIAIRKRLRSSEAVDDLRQEVYLRVFRALGSPTGGLREGSKLAPYVLAVAKNVVLEHIRQVSRTEPLEQKHLDIPIWVDPDDDLEREENRKLVHRVIREMEKENKRDADILRARFIDEGLPEDVSRQFGIKPSYLRVLLHRAKKKFRAMLRKK